MKREEMVCANCVYYAGTGQADDAEFVPIVCRYKQDKGWPNTLERQIAYTNTPKRYTPVDPKTFWCADGSWNEWIEEAENCEPRRYKLRLSYGDWED